MEQMVSDPPTASATELAARRGLGDWTSTYSTPQGWAYRKWRDSRLYLYGGGVVVTGRDGFEAAYDWGTTRVLVYRLLVNGGLNTARYTLIDPSGDAVNIGPGQRPVLKRQKESIGIREVVSGAPFLYPGDWGGYIQRNITQAQLQAVAARIAGGESVGFGPFTVDRHGLTGKKGTVVAWSQIAEVSMFTTMINFLDARKKNVLSAEFAYDIPNFELFYSLCHHLKG